VAGISQQRSRSADEAGRNLNHHETAVEQYGDGKGTRMTSPGRGLVMMVAMTMVTMPMMAMAVSMVIVITSICW
jgi:hypothetical protein